MLTDSFVVFSCFIICFFYKLSAHSRKKKIQLFKKILVENPVLCAIITISSTPDLLFQIHTAGNQCHEPSIVLHAKVELTA